MYKMCDMSINIYFYSAKRGMRLDYEKLHSFPFHLSQVIEKEFENKVLSSFN